MTALATLRMLRHVPARQVLHRLWYRARAPWFRSAAYDRWVLATGGAGRPPRFPPALWPGDAANGRRILAGTIRLVGLERRLEWSANAAPLLWRFALHGFDWLADLAALGEAAPARRLVDAWIDARARPEAVAWHPFPLSLRLYAWLRHASFLVDGCDGAFPDRLWRALVRQARHLARVVEWDVGGNHLLKNLKALAAAALCLPEAEVGLATVLARLEHQLGLQVLADGGHYERSPDYHVQVLCDLMDLEALLGREAPEWLGAAIGRMARALAFFRHGDGGLALFNDGTVGEAALLAAIEAQLGGLPAHAHADTLSFELSRAGQRIVVNCGTYAYQDAAWRNRLRGTASHSTVSVDGRDSAEVFATFRLGRRPRRVTAERRGLAVTARHDGYRHLGVEHARALSLEDGGRRLVGEDRLEGEVLGRTMTARFHLHPDVRAEAGGGRVRLELPGGGAWTFEGGPGRPRLEPSVWAPRFHEMVESRQIVLAAGAGARLAWSFRQDSG